MEITRTLAKYVADLGYDSIPDDVKRICRRAIIDTVGCAIAGSTEPAAVIAADLARQDGGNQRATVIGSSRRAKGEPLRVPAANAAMVNAIAGHALDYDDVNPMGHPSVPVCFTAIAAAEDAGARGRDVITAYAAGVELQTKINRAFGESHYLHGWHSTNTLGVLGAAAAAAKIYRLSAEQIAIAFGLAASQACGLRQNFGTMTKPYHPGHASWAGLTSARLARAGFSADSAILEAPLGYLKIFSAGPYEAAKAIADLDHWSLMSPGLSVKKYPCCYCTHATIDAALALKQRFAISTEDIVAITCEVTPFFLSPLIHHRPTTGLEGKFSLEYAVSAALIDSKVVLATFTDEMVQRPQARRLLEKVTETARNFPGEGTRATFARLTVELKGGRRLVEEVAEPRGTAANPLSDQELNDKFFDCCGFGGFDRARSSSVLDSFWKLEQLDRIDQLTDALA
jgi:2-methylcitrate dehydratase PrpD